MTTTNPSYLEHLAVSVEGIYENLDSQIRGAAVLAGLGCRSSCGECCLSPTIEASPIEMLPMALYLVTVGESDAFLSRFSTTQDSVCLMYSYDTSDSTRGHCRSYKYRPLVCRLFGYGTVHSKVSERPTLVSCHWQRELFTDALNRYQELAHQGMVPSFSDFSMQIRSLTNDPDMGKLLPINEALRIAIEKVSLVWALTSPNSTPYYAQDLKNEVTT